MHGSSSFCAIIISAQSPQQQQAICPLELREFKLFASSVRLRKLDTHTYIHMHTHLYSAKNRENESEALAQDD